jgi:polyisoprenoid-binding protein YceI
MFRAVAIILIGVGLMLGLAARADVQPWAVVPSESSIAMRVGSPLGQRSGRFERWTGDIRFDPQAPEQAEVSIEVEAASLRMDDGALTRTALGPSFLDSARHPRIAFRLQALEPLGPQRFQARADITMKGVTRPVSFPVTLRSDGRTAQMTGGFSLDRAAFGIGTRGPWNGILARQVRVDVVLATRPAS